MSENRQIVEKRESMPPRRDRYQQAAALLRQWQAEPDAYDERIWPALEKELTDSALRCSEKDESDS